MMELGPWIQAKAQVNGGTVKGISQLIQVNSEIIVLDVKRPGLLDENLSEVGIDAPCKLPLISYACFSKLFNKFNSLFILSATWFFPYFSRNLSGVNPFNESCGLCLL